jgi:hypothetical protein
VKRKLSVKGPKENLREITDGFPAALSHSFRACNVRTSCLKKQPHIPCTSESGGHPPMSFPTDIAYHVLDDFGLLFYILSLQSRVRLAHAEQGYATSAHALFLRCFRRFLLESVALATSRLTPRRSATAFLRKWKGQVLALETMLYWTFVCQA